MSTPPDDPRASSDAARHAIRHAQRIASQLHQLIAASITIATLHDERAILESLATSTRNVFDADLAMVSLEQGGVAPLRALARPGKLATCDVPGSDEDVPHSREGLTTTWEEGGWLLAPILERRDRPRGVIGVRRAEGDFAVEDHEVLTLLAQLAATTISAAELSRTVSNNEERWRVLVETAPVGIVESDTNGAVRWWNRSAARLFGWPDHDGAAGMVALPDAALEQIQELWNEAVKGATAHHRDFVDVEIDGRRRDLTASAALLPSASGTEPGVLTLFDDVTNHRQLRAEVRHAQTMEIRGQVASSVAHDFNNLLTLIGGYAEILTSDETLNERALEMVREIQTTASRAALLTAQLQTIGRTKPAEPVVFDPVSALASNAEVIERIVGSSINVVWSLPTTAGLVRADADQFEQMVLNLTINARDAMTQGGELEFTISARSIGSAQSRRLHVKPGDYVALRVRDTGTGMDEDTLARCFEPLFTTKGPYKGTGLGLATARRLVEESGGAITVTSEVGVGTTFDIVLPVVTDHDVEVVTSSDQARPRGSASVLLAEDDNDLRRLMVQVLERNGYLVYENNSAEAALALVDSLEGPIDLLVSDVVMDEMGGPELAEILQRRYGDLRVLLASGTADASIIAGLRANSATFLKKPFRPSQLIDEVHELLARRTN